MADILTTNTFATTYRDDYSDSDNYHRILFNAGRALQARELTQAQTIIQEEITRFGSNIFRDGSVVRAGNVTLNSSIEYIKLDTQQNPVPADINSLVGKVLTVQAPNPEIKVKVLYALPASDGDPATIYVKYVDTQAATSGEEAIRVPNNAILVSGELSNNLKAAASDATGRGTFASTESGDYFVKGRFVFARSQTAVVSRYSSSPTTDIGFQIIEDIVTVDDNVNLYDNQGETPNAAAPGADRYRIRLVLTTREEIQSGENFVYLARISNGRIIDIANPLDAYNKINDAMAIRTKEESGNYVVKPFIAKFDDLNDSNLTIDVSAGIAYVDGYRLDIPGEKITVPKAQDTISLESQNTIAQYGNYVIGDATTNLNLPDVSTFAEVNLRTSTNYGGVTIGTARVRAIQEDGANHNYYLFDIRMQSGQNFRNVQSFGTDVSNYVNVILEDGVALLKSTANNSLLFPLPYERPSVTGVNITGLTLQKKYQFTTNGTGSFSGLPATGSFTFTDTFQWVTTDEAGSIVVPTVQLIGNDTQANFSGLNPSTNYTVYAYVAKGSITERTKSLTIGETLTVQWPNDAQTDAAGNRYIDLGTADIFKVTEIKTDNTNGFDLSTNFIVDNGQRDNFYAKGRLIERGGVSIPSGYIFIKFDHFTHGASGDFFSVNSYNGVLNYEDIPTHKKANNEIVSLRDVLDFRPVQDINGGYTGTEGKIHLLPQNTDAITGEIEYYLPRKDRLVAAVENSRDGRFGRGSLQVIRGVPSITPQFPDIPTGTIPLYDISLNAYTLNDSDMATSFYANKRYTMKDISRLEQRIDDLTELTTLSLLELNTSSVAILDSAGIARTKSGFLADNFTNYAFSEIERDEYRAAIDPAENILTCEQFPNNLRLLYDDGASSSTLKGDLLLLPYSNNNPLVIQDIATETINVNPFAVVNSTGHMDLSPSSDVWVETQWAPDNIVDGGITTRTVGSERVVNNLATWSNSWFGRPVGDRVQVVTGSRVIRELVGERVVEIEIIPFMRSIKVGFRANGLRPFTRYFPFFDGVNVSEWVRQETIFERFAENTNDFGNIFTNAIEHPDNNTSLLSDQNGSIAGSFVIPSTNTLRFRTGSKIFKLLDISVDDEENATSNARATFTSSGTLETLQRTISSTRQLDLQWLRERPPVQNDRDPLAQSFRIDQFEHPSGIFLTKVRLYFATKDDAVPVQVEIRTMENGVPTGGPIPNAVKFLNPSEVNIPSDNDNLQIIRDAFTDFEFDEPVYLRAGQEYCFVIIAETTDYTVYCAKTYDFLLGSTEARVTAQPTLGSLFLSQNASTWTPDQSRDLMFTLMRARFGSSAEVVLENSVVPNHLLGNNPFLTDSGSTEVRVFNPGHGFIKGDTVTISGLDSSSTYAGISGSSLNGSKEITEVDYTGYKFDALDSATASLRTGGNNVIVSQNTMFNSYVPTLATLSPPNTQISANIRTTTGASFAEIGGGRNSSVNGAYAKSVSGTDITLNEINYVEKANLIASSDNEATNLSGDKSLTLVLNMSTTDDKVSPVVDLQRCAITTFENIIDNQDSAVANGFNIPLAYVDETHPTSGTAAAKHVTRPITLASDAVGLKIIFAANRPATSSFKVYYKTSAGDEVLDDIAWIEVQPESNIPSDDDGSTYRQYEYLAGGIGGALNTFNTFQVKIVMNGTNSSRPPKIKDLRAIALAT